jgi:surfeit locus 1 family protein
MMTNLKNMAGLCAFRPRLWTTLTMLLLVALFVSLGQWQWGKAERKAAAQALLDTHAVEAPISLPATRIADAAAFHFRRVAVQGHYRAAGQILLDNQMIEEQGERVGYRVLTPFVIDGAQGNSEVEVLVDRGWVAAPLDRRILPDAVNLAVSPAPTLLAGTAVAPARKHFALAADTASAGGNARWQFLDLDRYAREAKAELQPVIIRLDPGQPDGYLRVWPRPDDRNERHLSYALQWFGFAASTVGIWAWFGFRRTP